MSKQESNDFIVPVLPPEDHPYIHDLYNRVGLEPDSPAEIVMAAARNLWTPDKDSVASRAEAAELLLGRRVDGQELNTLPLSFRLHIFEPDGFEGFLNVVNIVAEIDSVQQ